MRLLGIAPSGLISEQARQFIQAEAVSRLSLILALVYVRLWPKAVVVLFAIVLR